MRSCAHVLANTYEGTIYVLRYNTRIKVQYTVKYTYKVMNAPVPYQFRYGTIHVLRYNTRIR